MLNLNLERDRKDELYREWLRRNDYRDGRGVEEEVK